MKQENTFRQGAAIVATLFLTLGLLYGIWYAYSVFLVALIEHFGWSRSVTAGAMSVFILTHGIFGPFAGRLVEKFGPRYLMMIGAVVMATGLLLSSQVTQWWQLYISFGLITALGLGACGWVPAVILTEQWFPNKVGTALGIVTAGIGVGMMVVVPLSNYLIENSNWRHAYQVLASMVLIFILPAAFFVLREPDGHLVEVTDEAENTDSNEALVLSSRPHWTLTSAFASNSFRFAVLAFFFGGCLTQLLLMHQFAFMVDHGVAKTMGSIIVGIIGVASIPGKIILGSLSDRIGRELAYSVGLFCILLSIGALALIGTVPGLLMPFAFALLVGFGYAANAPIIPAAARDLFAGPKFPVIFGTMSMFAAIGGATGSWLGGALFDLSGNYQLMLMTAAGLAILSPAMLWLAAPRAPQQPPHTSHN
ncbi:MAG: MFS transporter [Porticoccaceae bacterium]|nr:MFS transporter [Porticoccaceae bacterium]